MSKDKQSFKSACRLLTKTLAQDGITIPHTRILDIVARTRGYNDYQTYLGHLAKDKSSEMEPFKRSRVYITYKSSENDARKNGDILSKVIMEAFNNYYKRASMPSGMAHKKHAQFPAPSITYGAAKQKGEFLLTLEWLCGSDGLGPNAGIEFNTAFAIPYINRNRPEVFSLISGLEVVELRLTKADITPYLKNKELFGL